MKTTLTNTQTNVELTAVDGAGESRVSSWLLNSAQGKMDHQSGKGFPSGFKTILVPLTLVSDARATLGIAKIMAGKSEAKLVLLHVVQLNIVGERYGIPRTRLLNEMCQNAELQLQQLANCMGGKVATETLVCEGRPAEAIVETATRLQADMIVMHTYSRRGWLSWFRRNTARTVIREAPCKVCLVLAENFDEKVPLMIADHNGTKLFSEHMTFREKKRPAQSFFRALFS